MEPQAEELEARLRRDFPGRHIRVHAGDCNVKIFEALDGLRQVNWAPTFAFIDPNGPHVHWSTLQALAGFKKAKTTKIELWLLFPHAMFIRLLPRSGRVRPKHARQLTSMFGTDEWRLIYEARLSLSITPAQAREEYVNLMRWRLENVLGYRWTHAMELVTERSQPLYDMIFATDHEAGNRIMTSLYNSAASELPAMRRAAIEKRKLLLDEERGVLRLFEDGGSEVLATSTEKLYKHLPPARPFWIPEDAEG